MPAGQTLARLIAEVPIPVECKVTVATVWTPVTAPVEPAVNWIEPLEALFGKDPNADPGVMLTRLKLAAEYDRIDCTVLIEAPPVSILTDTTILEPVVTVWLAGERERLVPAAAWVDFVGLMNGRVAAIMAIITNKLAR